uniref:Uncharacterized protein n=1 Tax=Acrobeloides nanus TaxID=290746 RepID=A0A914D3S8_9BILA
MERFLDHGHWLERRKWPASFLALYSIPPRPSLSLVHGLIKSDQCSCQPQKNMLNLMILACSIIQRSAILCDLLLKPPLQIL